MGCCVRGCEREGVLLGLGLCKRCDREKPVRGLPEDGLVCVCMTFSRV